ncbi:hypothetical protein HPB49_002253 [Dermacentor silvarum]|uniref:Uncharacterized protein n=1 Tax=Dermacentor silvarum TaxID=543639 RepID=A0ACB8C1X4_DERSI|nr:hypothetical protein HPB49_002253 [Dermacentor silvarum]
MAAKRTRMRCFAGLFLLASVSCYMSNKDAGANKSTTKQDADSDLAFDAGSRFDTLQTSGGWAVRRECLYPQEVVFFIYSRPQDWRRRAAIRDSLFEEKAKGFFNWTGLFVVEQPPEDTADGAWTDLEAQVMGDVLLIPRIGRDVAPRKLLLGMQWILQHCARALYVIKVDDDVMIEPFVLFEYLISNVEPRGRLLHCAVMAYSHQEQNVSALSLVHSFCMGRAIIMNLPILTDLLRASRRLPPWSRWSEAAYVTGQLAVAAGLGHVDFGSRVAWRDSEAYSFVDGGWWIFFHLRGTFALTTLRRALWHQGIWNEALGDDKIRKGLSRRSKPAQYDPEIRYRYDD